MKVSWEIMDSGGKSFYSATAGTCLSQKEEKIVQACEKRMEFYNFYSDHSKPTKRTDIYKEEVKLERRNM